MDSPMKYQPDPRPLPRPLDLLSANGSTVGFYRPGKAATPDSPGKPGHPLCIATAIIAWGYDPLDRPVDLTELAQVRYLATQSMLRMDPDDPDLEEAQRRVGALDAMLFLARQSLAAGGGA
jgi:hypothetical protein